MLMYEIQLRRKKNFFPYDYWDSFEKFKEGLPSKNIFYNSLTNHTNSDKNYEHFFNVEKTFNMNTMKDSHDL